MVLKDIDLNRSYDSRSDDVVNQFYIPALSHAIVYKRMAGFFSSTSLAMAARGVFRFMRNKGHMQMICGAGLHPDQCNAGLKGDELISLVERVMISELELIEDEFIKDHLHALGWMMAHNALEIRLALPVDENGFLLERSTVENSGIFHEKVGIVQDEKGDVITFSGVFSESVSWQSFFEEFKVFRSWNPYEEEYTRIDTRKFEEYWNNAAEHVQE